MPNHALPAWGNPVSGNKALPCQVGGEERRCHRWAQYCYRLPFHTSGIHPVSVEGLLPTDRVQERFKRPPVMGHGSFLGGLGALSCFSLSAHSLQGSGGIVGDSMLV